MGNEVDAQDALATACLKAHDEMPRFAARIRNVRSWLASLIRNLCLDLHRERRRQADPAGSIEDIGQLVEQTPYQFREVPLEQLVFAKRAMQMLDTAIETLPPKLRETFKLRFIHELSYQEIAEMLQTNSATVRKRIEKARSILQTKVDR